MKKLGILICFLVIGLSNVMACKSGMRQAKVFASGLDIGNQTDWIEISKGLWEKKLSLLIIQNNKNCAKITIMRKVDKESLFHQELFNIKQ